jgi:hypothetical protein
MMWDYGRVDFVLNRWYVKLYFYGPAYMRIHEKVKD